MTKNRIQRPSSASSLPAKDIKISQTALISLACCLGTFLAVIISPSLFLSLMFGKNSSTNLTTETSNSIALGSPKDVENIVNDKPATAADLLEFTQKVEVEFSNKMKSSLLFKAMPKGTNAVKEINKGKFQILTKVPGNKTVEVMYSIPKGGPQSLPYWVMYCTYPDEFGFVNSDLFSKIPLELGIPVFGMAFKDMSPNKVDYSDHAKCYYYKESGSYDAVILAREKMKEVLGVVTPPPLLLIGTSGGGSWAMQLASTNPKVFLGTVTAAGASVPELPTWRNDFSALALSTYGDNEDVTRRNDEYIEKLKAKGAHAERIISPPVWDQRGIQLSFFCHSPNSSANSLMLNWLQDLKVGLTPKDGKKSDIFWRDIKTSGPSLIFPGQRSLNDCLNLPPPPITIKTESGTIYFSLGAPTLNKLDLAIILSPLGGLDSYNAKFNCSQLSDLKLPNIIFGDCIGGPGGSQGSLAVLESSLEFSTRHGLKPTIVCWGGPGCVFSSNDLEKFSNRVKGLRVISVTTIKPNDQNRGQCNRFGRTIYVKNDDSQFPKNEQVVVIERKDMNEMTIQSRVVTALVEMFK